MGKQDKLEDLERPGVFETTHFKESLIFYSGYNIMGKIKLTSTDRFQIQYLFLTITTLSLNPYSNQLIQNET